MRNDLPIIGVIFYEMFLYQTWSASSELKSVPPWLQLEAGPGSRVDTFPATLTMNSACIMSVTFSVTSGLLHAFLDVEVLSSECSGGVVGGDEDLLTGEEEIEVEGLVGGVAEQQLGQQHRGPLGAGGQVETAGIKYDDELYSVVPTCPRQCRRL